MTRWTAVEVLGVLLIGIALGFIHVAVAIGWLGLYLLVTALISQLVGAREPRKADTHGEED